MEPKMYTLKVNIRAQEEKEKRLKERQTREAISKLQSASGPPALPRKRKGLNFHQPGTFIAQAEQLRKKARLEALQKKIADSAAKTGIADAAKLASLTTNKISEKASTQALLEGTDEEEVPEVEWWDKAILGKQKLEYIIPRLVQSLAQPEELFQNITNLVEHPYLKKPPNSGAPAVPIPIFLTKKEIKKLRRQNRKNQQLDKQEKIKLGLLPQPEPKLKRSNIKHVLGDEAPANPTMVEQMVKDQEEKRLKAHLEHNESRKLTLEEKRLKKLRKVQEDLSVTGVWVAVYRILSLVKQSRKLKIIEQKAKQLTMTGTICISNNINLVLVEGGPKQQRKFKQLILNRIKWSEDSSTGESSDKNAGSNRCLLVWEGQVAKRTFNFFKSRLYNSESEARSHFKKFNVEHYYDLAYKMSILESISDT
uniref:U4/U6 small nuclear ribonucleoprotein Prp3 n=1 Tax=Aceria tosichella TaxID=561515 RepID=A0A6G1S626_9ACAR